MEEKSAAAGAVRNVFKDGQMPTREEYTRVWIRMVNQMERLKTEL